MSSLQKEGTAEDADLLSLSVDELLQEGESGKSLYERTPRDLTARVVSSRTTLRKRIVEIVKSRELFVFLVRKELKVKYKGSVLGILWSLLNPAVTLAVYYVVFQYFLKSAIPDFAIYLFAGLIVWNLFLTALIGSSSTIVANAGIVKKVSFPREILAFAQVGTSTMFFFFQSIVLVLFLVGFQFHPDWSYLPLVPYALLDLIIFTAALAIFLSAANVYFRDIEHLVAVLLNAWFWGVPIIYSFIRVAQHHWLRVFYFIDPMTTIVISFQRAIYGRPSYFSTQQGFLPVSPGSKIFHQVTSTTPNAVLINYPYHFYVMMLSIVLGVSVLLLLGAMKVFGRVEGNFAEEL